MTDRDLVRRLPQVELDDLAGSVDRPLERPGWRREQRPDFARVVIDDGLADGAAQRLSSSRTLTPGSLGSLFNSRWISGLSGSSTLVFGAR
jgi:hypothetical protein